MKVYVLWYYFDTDTTIHGVFDSEEKAWSYANELFKETNDYLAKNAIEQEFYDVHECYLVGEFGLNKKGNFQTDNG